MKPETMEMTIEATNPDPNESITNPAPNSALPIEAATYRRMDYQVEHTQRKHGYGKADKLEEGFYGHVQKSNDESHHGNGAP